MAGQWETAPVIIVPSQYFIVPHHALCVGGFIVNINVSIGFTPKNVNFSGNWWTKVGSSLMRTAYWTSKFPLVGVGWFRGRFDHTVEFLQKHHIKMDA